MIFELFDIYGLISQDLTNSNFPTYIKGWNNSNLILNEGATHFGYVYAGALTLEYDGQLYTLQEGMYFSIPKEAKLQGDGLGLVISRIGVLGLFSIGGKVEHKGRLKYIDGCYDTLLISPTILGDPCLNFLYMPHNVNQTRHTHPSLRIGIILSGEGLCMTPQGNYPLTRGKIFVMHTDCEHSFHTTNQELRILIYHPDSDFGPTNDNHPIINRTIVGNISASTLTGIQTK